MHRALHRVGARVLILALVAGAFAVLMATPRASAQTPVPGTPSNGRSCTPIDEKALRAPYVLKYGLSITELQQQFYGQSNMPNDGSYNDLGYSPVRTTGYTADGSVFFATKWAKTGGPSWSSKFGLIPTSHEGVVNWSSTTEGRTSDGGRRAAVGDSLGSRG
jgi:hypothetical protein